MSKIERCGFCGEVFRNAFAAIDHLQEDGEPPFEPRINISGGYSILVGTFLRDLYASADNPHKVRDMAESLFATLYAAYYNPGVVSKVAEEKIVKRDMKNIDKEINEFFNGI